MAWKGIGIFDSGVGGLTVLKEIVKALPREDTVYFGDTGRVPYGTKSPETIVRYSLEISSFLVDYNIKLLVVACNTASAVALEALKERFSIPIIGVIDPGARRAAAVTVNGRVGVIGTEATIKSGAYARAIKQFNPEIQVLTRACPLFVPLAEEGWTDNGVARLAAETYLAGLRAEGIDTLVLGCTHYPLLKKIIGEVMGDGVKLVDSAEETARTVVETLRSRDLLRLDSEEGSRRYFVSDEAEGFIRAGYRFLGDNPGAVCYVRIENQKV